VYRYDDLLEIEAMNLLLPGNLVIYGKCASVFTVISRAIPYIQPHSHITPPVDEHKVPGAT